MNDQPEMTPINETPLTAAIPGLPDPEPTESSSLDDLAAYGLRKQDQIIARDRANAEDMWLMGRALRWAKAKMPHGSWEDWLREKKFKKTWAWKARKLSEAATLEEVNNLGLTEALVRFNIDKPKPAPAKQPPAKTKGKKQEEADKVQEPPTQGEPEGTQEAGQPEQEEEQPEPEEVDTPEDEGAEKESPEDEVESEEDSEAAEAEGVFRETLKLFPPHIRATAVLNALEDLNDDLAGPCDDGLLNTFDLILDLVEAIKLKGHEDDADLEQYQPATIPDELLVG